MKVKLTVIAILACLIGVPIAVFRERRLTAEELRRSVPIGEYRERAFAGDAKAQHNLGVCFENGWGVIKNPMKAVEWYRKAAEQGNVRAQRSLGACYLRGWGVEMDQTEALKWFRRAEEQENAGAGK